MNDPVHKEKDWEAYTGPEILQGRGCCWLEVENILCLGPNSAILGFFLIHSSPRLLSPSQGSLVLDTLKRKLQNSTFMGDKHISQPASHLQEIEESKCLYTSTTVRGSLFQGWCSFSRNTASLSFDSRKLHPSKAIHFFLEILVPLSSSRFNSSHFDPIRLWWESYTFMTFTLFRWENLLRHLNLLTCFHKSVMATFLSGSWPWGWNWPFWPNTFFYLK